MKADLLSPTQLAFVLALRAAIPASEAAIRHTMEQDAKPPFILVGNVESEPAGDDYGEQLELISVEVQTVYRGSDRSKLLALMHKVRAACDQVALPQQAGIEFGLPRWTSSAASSTPPDGVTFAGLTNFQIHVQPA